MLSRGWLVILCATVLSAGATECAQLFRKPEYVASAQLFAVVPGDAGVRSAYEGDRGATVRMTSYAQLATSEVVTRRTIDDVHLNTTPSKLADCISVELVPKSALINIQVTGHNADTSVQTVNALARNLVSISQEVEWSDSGPGAELVPVDAAVSAHQSRGSLPRNLGLGAAIGLALSCLLVLAREVARSIVLDLNQLNHVVEQTISADMSGTVL